MAVRIPIYESKTLPQGGVQARATPLQQTDVLGNAVARFGSTAAQVAGMVAADINEARVREVDNQASAAIRGLLYDPEKGYLAATGKDAVDRYQDTEAAIKQLGEQLAGGLQSPGQREMFDRVWQRRADSALNSIAVHAAQQSKVYNNNQAEARSALSIDDAVASYGNAPAFNTARATAITEAAHGKTGAEAELAAKQAETKIHLGVLNNLFSSERTAEARAYYDANRGQIAAQYHDEIQQKLQAGVVKNDSLTMAFALQSEYGSLKEQRAALDQKFQNGEIDAELRDATLVRLEHDNVQREKLKTEYDSSMEGNAQDWLLKNPGKTVLDMPPEMYAWAKSKGQLDRLRSFAERGGEGGGDNQLFTEWRFMASDDPIRFTEAFRREAPFLRGKLSGTQYNNLLGLATSANAKDLKAQEATKVAADTVRSLTKDLQAAGLRPTSTKEQDAERMAAFQGRLLQDLDSATRAKGSALTPEESRKIGLNLLQEGRLQGSGTFWDTKKMRFEVAPEEQATTPFVSTEYAKIPMAEQQQIETWLKAHPETWKRFKVVPQPGVNMTNTREWKNAVEVLYQRIKERQ